LGCVQIRDPLAISSKNKSLSGNLGTQKSEGVKSIQWGKSKGKKKDLEFLIEVEFGGGGVKRGIELETLIGS